MVKHAAQWPRNIGKQLLPRDGLHECRGCGAHVTMWLGNKRTSWQCQCGAWNLWEPPPAKSQAQHAMDARKLAPKPQQPCDVGLFSDDKDQTEMF